VLVRVLSNLVIAFAVILSSIPAFARPHKVRVSDPAAAAELKAQGARLLADYGSFQLFETVAAPTTAALKRDQRRERR
jgi:hypothetical protein